MKFEEENSSSEPNEHPKKSLGLSLEQGFEWKQNFFYCGKLYLIDERQRERSIAIWWRLFILEKSYCHCVPAAKLIMKDQKYLIDL